MTSRKWVYLFLTSLLIGATVGIIVGFAVYWDKYAEVFKAGDIKGIISTAFWFIGMGCIFSLISQMGFFAYLTVHRFGLGMFRTISLWNKVQFVLIVFVLVDLVYLRYNSFAKEGESIFAYILPALLILVFSIIVAYIKAKGTNKEAFIPALFFMVVVSILEWVPALRANDTSWLYFMILPLLICNAWQVLILHKLTQKS